MNFDIFALLLSRNIVETELAKSECWMLVIEKMEMWSEISVNSKPLKACSSRLFVKMLSIRVAVSGDKTCRSTSNPKNHLSVGDNSGQSDSDYNHQVNCTACSFPVRF